MKRFLWIGALTLGTALPALTQQSPPQKVPRPEVLVLGVYHMSNPGHDLFDVQADDVLAPRRQAEIEEVVAVLKEFHPTKIAVEEDVWDKKVPRDYADYLAGKHELTRNEVEQIGFRLARQLGHKAIYPVDTDGDFPYQRVVDYAKASGRSAELDALMSEVGAGVKGESASLASHSVLKELLDSNSDDSVADGMALYYRQARFGEPGDWAGADLVSDWYRRNMRIYSNVMQLIDSPNERVLVIFGSGHLGWLRQDFAGNPDVRLRKLSEFAK